MRYGFVGSSIENILKEMEEFNSRPKEWLVLKEKCKKGSKVELCSML